MAHTIHHYAATITWTGNTGAGTTDYKAYERSHTAAIQGKAEITCSSDPKFRGDGQKHNPEDLLVTSLSSCHMLWYLHLCSAHGVIVTAYTDEATGVMEENADGSGQFVEVTLTPRVTVKEESMVARSLELHEEANKMCFIARSVRFPVRHKPTAIVETKR
jgi:organic hydroperoxide reductase OsmC/OhrA